MVRRFVLLLVTLVASGCALAGECPGDRDLRSAIRAAIVADGYRGSVTISRNESRPLLLPVGGIEKFTLYEIQEGGVEQDERGRSIITISSTSSRWRVFINEGTGELFRIYGFRSGQDFSLLVQSLQLHVDRQMAESVATEYAELTYSDSGEVVTSVYGALAYIAATVGGSSAEHEKGCVKRSLRKLTGQLLNHSFGVVSRPVETGYAVELNVAEYVDMGGGFVSIELHEIEVNVDSKGQVAIGRDELVFSIDPESLDCLE